jgi:hypothetical protein
LRAIGIEKVDLEDT